MKIVGVLNVETKLEGKYDRQSQMTSSIILTMENSCVRCIDRYVKLLVKNVSCYFPLQKFVKLKISPLMLGDTFSCL